MIYLLCQKESPSHLSGTPLTPLGLLDGLGKNIYHYFDCEY